MKIAITGNIGSGKSEAINFFRKLNFKCISSDKIISEFYKDDSKRKRILKNLGLSEKNYKQEIIIRLSDEKFNRELKKILYPMLHAKKKILSPHYDIFKPVFYEVPLLYEEKLAHSFDLTVFIKSDVIKRKKRVLKRGVSQNYFNLMNYKQMNQNQKELLADYTITNNGSILNLRLNIITLLNQI